MKTNLLFRGTEVSPGIQTGAKAFRTGEVIYKNGDPAEGVYLLLSGEVLVKVFSKQGVKLVIKREGEFFGALEIAENSVRGISATAGKGENLYGSAAESASEKKSLRKSSATAGEGVEVVFVPVAEFSRLVASDIGVRENLADYLINTWNFTPEEVQLQIEGLKEIAKSALAGDFYVAPDATTGQSLKEITGKSAPTESAGTAEDFSAENTGSLSSEQEGPEKSAGTDMGEDEEPSFGYTIPDSDDEEEEEEVHESPEEPAEPEFEVSSVSDSAEDREEDKEEVHESPEEPAEPEFEVSSVSDSDENRDDLEVEERNGKDEEDKSKEIYQGAFDGYEGDEIYEDTEEDFEGETDKFFDDEDINLNAHEDGLNADELLEEFTPDEIDDFPPVGSEENLPEHSVEDLSEQSIEDFSGQPLADESATLPSKVPLTPEESPTEEPRVDELTNVLLRLCAANTPKELFLALEGYLPGLVGAGEFSMFVFDGGFLSEAGSTGKGDKNLAMREKIAYELITMEEPVALFDINDPGLFGGFESVDPTNSSNSLLYFPLLNRNKTVVGCFLFFSEKKGSFTSQHSGLLSEIATATGGILEKLTEPTTSISLKYDDLGKYTAFFGSEIKMAVDTILSVTGSLDRSGSLDRGKQSDKVRFGLEVIKERASGLKGFLDSIRFFLGKVSGFSKQPFLVSELLDDFLMKVSDPAKQREITLLRKYDADAVLFFNRELFLHALGLITQNAFDAMPAGGKIFFSTSTVNEEDIRISIRDTGPGVPAEIENKIFEPFFTYGKTGVGLGLPIANKIIKEHGGYIYAESSGKKGAEIIVVLPL
ncbi:MAG: cyclic nucleotide-binding domain-containing protein [Ignavibacteriales bacterium]|nr:cyclic nucleotide-binding domain-containing protein [Ignavibacteria bacterium]MBZ0197203.1 cyclic nucleotide-binding domain-containing protein [Ignavibacteriaceae bacterium]MCZ2143521.1 cyclic nucleotide-binding domain-containing protein [Ignavibacteriales bacterium]WKZ72155.1 MAG: ATP-binding protein [Ignavibacteriaceae bacterium]